MYCLNCGTQVQEGTKTCPACGAGLPRPVSPLSRSRKALPIVSLICGAAAYAIAGLGGTVVLAGASDAWMTGAVAFCAALVLTGLVCGIIGLIRSIRIPGRQKIVWTIFSGVGIYASAQAAVKLAQSLITSRFAEDVIERYVPGILR